MCFDPESRPPIPPIAGGAAEAGDRVLTSTDGTRFAAYAARAATPSGAGMVVIPDVRGLHAYYKELALRFAEAGVDAVAIDFFARTAESGDRGEGFDFMAHVPRTTPATLQADIAAAVAFLRGPEGGAVRSVFSVGFCFGGALSFLQAASRRSRSPPHSRGRWPDRPKPIDAVGRFACPVLALYGGADPGIPPTAVEEFAGALDRAGVTRESVVYEGAPHSFFDRRQTEFADASADAWKRVRGFVARYGGTAGR